MRGVTPDLFYGRILTKNRDKEGKGLGFGLKDIFTIYSSGEQIDINSASFPVLRVVLGLPTEVAKALIKAREEKGFQNQQDLVLRVPEIIPLIGEIAGRATFSTPYTPLTMPYYTIESRGKSKERGAVRGLKTIVKIDPAEKKGYKTIQWVDSIVSP